MKKMILAVLVIICAIVIVRAFFLPWAKVSASVTKVSKELSQAAAGPLENTPFAGKFISIFEKTTKAIGEVGDIEVKTMVSGYDIPTMVNKKSSKVAISFAQTFFKDAEGLDKKSMLVFLLPLFAIVCGLLAVAGIRYNWAPVPMLIISGAISLVGLYNLKTLNLSSSVVAITIEKGLWQTIYAYLVIFILSIAWIASDIAQRKNK